MIIRYSPEFLKIVKKVDVRIQKSFKKKIDLFYKNPDDLHLNNHSLRDEYEGYRSVDITSDWRAIYKEVIVGQNHIAYFIALGTHKELYGR